MVVETNKYSFFIVGERRRSSGNGVKVASSEFSSVGKAEEFAISLGGRREGSGASHKAWRKRTEKRIVARNPTLRVLESSLVLGEPLRAIVREAEQRWALPCVTAAPGWRFAPSCPTHQQ